MTLKLNPPMIKALEAAFDKVGWTFNALLLLASEKGAFCALQQLRHKADAIELDALRINLSKDPSTCADYRDAVFHAGNGQHPFIWCDETTMLYNPLFDTEQTLKADLAIERLATAGRLPLNANALDVVLCSQHLIPPEWELPGGRIYFYGTRFKSSGELIVRYMHKNKEKWEPGVEKLSGTLKLGDRIACEVIV